MKFLYNAQSRQQYNAYIRDIKEVLVSLFHLCLNILFKALIKTQSFI